MILPTPRLNSRRANFTGRFTPLRIIREPENGMQELGAPQRSRVIPIDGKASYYDVTIDRPQSYISKGACAVTRDRQASVPTESCSH